jgi:hypothetical protein
VTRVENSAESGTTVRPQTIAAATSNQVGASTSRPIRRAQVPEAKRAVAAVSARPILSATTPPSTQPMPPRAITANAVYAAVVPLAA